MKKPHVILGIGKSGLSAMNLLLLKGISASDIFTFDEKNETAQYNNWDQLYQLPTGYFILSPGIPLANKHLQKLISNGWQLTSEINLATEYLTDEILIGITGSVGKSTVTTLIGRAVLTVDQYAFIGGNLGIPFCDYALRLLENPEKKAKYIILELSSYQLENCQNLKLDYSIITYLSANHLERYPTIEDYYKTKCSIGLMTKNICLINSTSPDLMKNRELIACKTIPTNRYSMDQNNLNKINLIGEHNYDNVSLAVKLCQLLLITEDEISSVYKYKGLPHRLETVTVLNNVLYVNDSKATAMDSVLVATSACLTKVPSNSFLYLLLGGKDKNLPWEQLNILKNKNIKFVFFGNCGELAQKKAQLQGQCFNKLQLAVEFVKKEVHSGDVVLLSPGGTSLDEFNNFEERGLFFKNLIKEIN